MIRLAIAVYTEVLGARVAANSVLGHVHGSFLGDELTLVISLTLDDLAGNELHDIAARTANKVRVKLNNLHLLSLFDLRLLFLSQVLVQLVFLDGDITLGAFHLFILALHLLSILLQAVDMDLMEAVGRLEHGHIEILFILGGDLLLAKLAKSLLHLLHYILIVGLGPLPLSRVHEHIHIHNVGLVLAHVGVRSSVNWLVLIHIWWHEEATSSLALASTWNLILWLRRRVDTVEHVKVVWLNIWLFLLFLGCEGVHPTIGGGRPIAAHVLVNLLLTDHT